MTHTETALAHLSALLPSSAPETAEGHILLATVSTASALLVQMERIADAAQSALRLQAEASVRARVNSDLIASQFATMRSRAAAPESLNIGAATLERVFRANGITDLSNLQLVLDAVEKALTTPTEG